MASSVTYTITVETKTWGPNGSQVSSDKYDDMAAPKIIPGEQPILVLDNKDGHRRAMLVMSHGITVRCEPHAQMELLSPTLGDKLLIDSSKMTH